MRRTLFASLFLVCFACFACREPPPTHPGGPKLQRSVEPLALASWDKLIGELGGTMREGNAQTLSALLPKDQPVLLVFWATYCPPCIEEMPHLQLLFHQKRAIIGISLDASDAEKAAAVLSKHGVEYPSLVLDSASTKKAGAALERGLPFAIAVGADGHVQELFFGGLEGADIETIFARYERRSHLPPP